MLLITAIAIFSCLIQPDLGMTFLICITTGMLILITGEYLKYYFIVALITLSTFIISGIFLAKYSVSRLLIFFGQKQNFQVQQSLIGLAQSNIIGIKQKIYIPDAHCDFIFSEICIDFGYIMAAIIIIIPIIIIYKCLPHIKKLSIEKTFILVSSVSLFSFQTYFHILSNLKFVPTKGLTLPFISHGGSSLLAYGILFGIILNLTKKQIFIFNIKNDQN